MRFIIAVLVMTWIMPVQAATPSAAEVAAKVAAKLRQAPGIKAEFSIDADGQKATGSLLAAGKKFRLMSGGFCSWYDGKTLYTLNPRSKETTVVTPTPSELLEANPLLYIGGSSDAYSVAFSSHQPKGKYMLVLTPKRKGDSIKSVFVTIDSKSLLPENIVVTGSDGNVSTLSITSLRLNMSIGAGIFIYPKAKYPSFKVVDLR